MLSLESTLMFLHRLLLFRDSRNNECIFDPGLVISIRLPYFCNLNLACSSIGITYDVQ
jgi:hypothetical protein